MHPKMLLCKGADPGYFFEIFITVQKANAVLHCDLGDAAIDRAVDGYSLAPQVEKYPGRCLPCSCRLRHASYHERKTSVTGRNRFGLKQERSEI